MVATKYIQKLFGPGQKLDDWLNAVNAQILIIGYQAVGSSMGTVSRDLLVMVTVQAETQEEVDKMLLEVEQCE